MIPVSGSKSRKDTRRLHRQEDTRRRQIESTGRYGIIDHTDVKFSIKTARDGTYQQDTALRKYLVGEPPYPSPGFSRFLMFTVVHICSAL